MKEWNQKGCDVCRKAWETGQRLTELAVDQERHTTLYRCSACGAYWEESERYAEVIEEEMVSRLYPGLRTSES